MEKINQLKREGIDFFNQESERICVMYKDNVEKVVGNLYKKFYFL